MTTFVDGVNRILRQTTVISNDDDDIASFSDTQHKATIQLAKMAIQSTLTSLIADRIIPYEEADGTITCVTDQRTYTLPADFVRFKGNCPFLLELDGGISANTYVTYIDEEKLRREVLDYRSQSGNPYNFYVVNTTSKSIGLYPVPDSSKNGVQYRFPYEKNVSVEEEADSLPFHSTQEDYAFLDMAARRFEYSIKQIQGNVEDDPIYRAGKTALMALVKPIIGANKYGHRYG